MITHHVVLFSEQTPMNLWTGLFTGAALLCLCACVAGDNSPRASLEWLKEYFDTLNFLETKEKEAKTTGVRKAFHLHVIHILILNSRSVKKYLKLSIINKVQIEDAD